MSKILWPILATLLLAAPSLEAKTRNRSEVHFLRMIALRLVELDTEGSPPPQCDFTSYPTNQPGCVVVKITSESYFSGRSVHVRVSDHVPCDLLTEQLARVQQSPETITGLLVSGPSTSTSAQWLRVLILNKPGYGQDQLLRIRRLHLTTACDFAA